MQPHHQQSRMTPVLVHHTIYTPQLSVGLSYWRSLNLCSPTEIGTNLTSRLLSARHASAMMPTSKHSAHSPQRDQKKPQPSGPNLELGMVAGRNELPALSSSNNRHECMDQKRLKFVSLGEKRLLTFYIPESYEFATSSDGLVVGRSLPQLATFASEPNAPPS